MFKTQLLPSIFSDIIYESWMHCFRNRHKFYTRLVEIIFYTHFIVIHYVFNEYFISGIRLIPPRFFFRYIRYINTYRYKHPLHRVTTFKYLLKYELKLL